MLLINDFFQLVKVPSAKFRLHNKTQQLCTILDILPGVCSAVHDVQWVSATCHSQKKKVFKWPLKYGGPAVAMSYKVTFKIPRLHFVSCKLCDA